jgi:uncharacterized repeat protein (TIGR03806 family)
MDCIFSLRLRDKITGIGAAGARTVTRFLIASCLLAAPREKSQAAAWTQHNNNARAGSTETALRETAFTATEFIQDNARSGAASAGLNNFADFALSGGIGVVFIGAAVDGNDQQGLLPGDIAGVIPQANWNNLPTNPTVPLDRGLNAPLVDENGQATTVTVNWAATRYDGTASGNSDPNHKLFKGLIANDGGYPAAHDPGDPPGTPPVSVVFKNLPAPGYQVLVYVIYDDVNSLNDYWVNGDTNHAYHIIVQGPSYGGTFVRASSTDPNNRQTGNYVQFDAVQPVAGTITIQAYGEENPNAPWLNLRGLVSAVQLNPRIPPVVALASPANGASIVGDSASVLVSATASVPLGVVTNVSFYAGNTLIGTLTDAPYTLTWTGVAPGQYSLSAIAITGTGAAATSAPVNITVSADYGLTVREPVPAYLNMPPLASAPFPALLSGTGAFSDTPDMVPSPGLIPYSVILPLWSDGAAKKRWMAVPNSGPPFTPDTQIQFAETGEWTFPNGTVFVKHFDLNTDETNPSVLQRLETRLLVRSSDGGVYGVTYKWRPDNSEGDIVTNSFTENIVITNATGVRTQAWYYPAPSDCLVCHIPAANYVLGVKTRQLNCDFAYPGATGTGNQLRTLNQLGLLFPPIADESAIAGFSTLVSYTNSSAGPEERARSYLDANCSNCHRPGGVSDATFDARWDTPASQQNIVNGPVVASLGIDSPAVVVPNDIWRSIMCLRVNSTDPTIKMQPLAHNAIDANAVEVLTEWVNSLAGTPTVPPPAIAPTGGIVPPAPGGITLSDADPFATIYVTLDASAPTTNSAVYTGPLLLASNATVTAIAARPGFVDSVAVSEAFVVNSFRLVPQSYSPNNGQFIFRVGTAPGSYVVQCSTNLVNWTCIGTNTAPGNLLEFVDAPGFSPGPRFYRVLQR